MGLSNTASTHEYKYTCTVSAGMQWWRMHVQWRTAVHATHASKHKDAYIRSILLHNNPRNITEKLLAQAPPFTHESTPLTRSTERPDILHTAAITLPSTTQNNGIVEPALHMIWTCSFWPSLKVWSTLQARVHTGHEWHCLYNWYTLLMATVCIYHHTHELHLPCNW